MMTSGRLGGQMTLAAVARTPVTLQWTIQSIVELLAKGAMR
jgi:hypothetical protein